MLRWFVIAAELAVYHFFFWRTAGADADANGAGTVGA